MSSERPDDTASGSSASERTRSRARAKPEQRPAGKKPAQRGVQETSAGGVVLRGEPGREQVIVIVPIRRAPNGKRVLGLPKGHIDPGETALQAAIREVREETGVLAESLGELEEVRYWYRRDGRTIAKSVVFFLCRYISGDTADHDDEVEQARWIDLREAQTALSYEGERGAIARAITVIEDAPGGISKYAPAPRPQDR